MRIKLIISFLLQAIGNALLYISSVEIVVLTLGYVYNFWPIYILSLPMYVLSIIGFILENQVKKKKKLHWTFVIPHFLFIFSNLPFIFFARQAFVIFTIFDVLMLIYLALNIFILVYIFSTNTTQSNECVKKL